MSNATAAPNTTSVPPNATVTPGPSLHRDHVLIDRVLYAWIALIAMMTLVIACVITAQTTRRVRRRAAAAW